MTTKIRKAKPADAIDFMRIKASLPMPKSWTDKTAKGGFLLGTDLKTYQTYIKTAFCLVAENHNGLVGFGIIFPDQVFRTTEVWEKRHLAQWFVNRSDYEVLKLCYFEQLAFLPFQRRWAIALGYHLAKWAFQSGHDALLATIVNRPIRNTAALPFIHTVGGIHAGNIDEVYPIVGAINSDIFAVKAPIFFEQTQNHALYDFVESVDLNL